MGRSLTLYLPLLYIHLISIPFSRILTGYLDTQSNIPYKPQLQYGNPRPNIALHKSLQPLSKD